MPASGKITSAANPLVQDVRRAIQRGSLSEEGYAIAESFHLLDEALRSECEVGAVLAASSAMAAVEKRARGLRVVELPDALFQKLASTETSQGVIAMVRPRQWALSDLWKGRPLVVVLDALRDPGNGGAVVRTAEAFGASGVIFLKDSVSPHNPKMLRAAAGSMFRIPYVYGITADAAIAGLRDHGVDLYAAMPASADARPIDAVDLRGACAIAIGNEGQGVSARVRDAASPISIPTRHVESLNAAVAAGILLYEASRQRGASA